MSHTVLLVEPDVDALGELAEGLRNRGLEVLLADSVEGALSRASTARINAILVADTLLEDPNSKSRLSSESAFAKVQRWILVGPDVPIREDSNSLPRNDPETIARRLFTALTRPPPASTDRGDFRGDLQQVSVPDLLQLLSMNRRTGTLTIVTGTGQGELRIADGEVVDAVFRRVEGTKALFRLLAESDGSFSFVTGTPTALRRVTEPTRMLLLEGLRHIDETRVLLERLCATEDALQATRPPLPSDEETTQKLLTALEVPKTAHELLDELTCSDLEILTSVEALSASGLIRRIERGALRVDLAEPEQLSVLSAIVRQLKRPGFNGNPRIILFAPPSRLAAGLHALGRIADSLVTTDSSPTPPVATRLATLRLADGQELDVIGIPNNLAYCPLWNLSLPGSSALITLGHEHTELLEEATSLAGIILLDAETLLGQIDEGEPRQMAALIRAALESAAGR